MRFEGQCEGPEHNTAASAVQFSKSFHLCPALTDGGSRRRWANMRSIYILIFKAVYIGHWEQQPYVHSLKSSTWLNIFLEDTKDKCIETLTIAGPPYLQAQWSWVHSLRASEDLLDMTRLLITSRRCFEVQGDLLKKLYSCTQPPEGLTPSSVKLLQPVLIIAIIAGGFNYSWNLVSAAGVLE